MSIMSLIEVFPYTKSSKAISSFLIIHTLSFPLCKVIMEK